MSSMSPASKRAMHQRFWRWYGSQSKAKRVGIFFVVGVGYLVFPFDAIPDFIPVIGQVDDVGVLAVTALQALRSQPRVDEVVGSAS